MRLFIVLAALSTLFSCSEKPNSSTHTNKVLPSKIMNGKVVKDSESLAKSIVGLYDKKYNAICTGSLVAPNIVVTAAHCAPDSPTDLKVVFATDIDETIYAREQDILEEYVLSVTDVVVSPNWNPNNETIEVDTSDIALVKFKGALPAGYRPATLLKNQADVKVGTNVVVAGYGVDAVNLIEINPKKYPKLDEALENGDVICSGKKKHGYGDCFEVERTGDGILRVATAPISQIHETEVRLNEKTAGTCNGDSGGPAYILKDGIYYLFGVTSRGSEYCNEVGVYTNILSHLNWLEKTVSELSKK